MARVVDKEPFDPGQASPRSRRDRKVGGFGAVRGDSVDVRVVQKSTNVNLEKAVEEGRFRADLYYRLRGQVALPPLRDRPSDVPNWPAISSGKINGLACRIDYTFRGCTGVLCLAREMYANSNAVRKSSQPSPLRFNHL